MMTVWSSMGWTSDLQWVVVVSVRLRQSLIELLSKAISVERLEKAHKIINLRVVRSQL